jgi:ribonuclease BN (tRNA processing enzyme)
VQLQILGGHQVESSEGRATAFLIDGTIAIDAGGLTGGLTLAEQLRIKSILVTHYHFDHITDLPFIGLLALETKNQIAIHCTQQVRDALVQGLLNGVIWLNLFNSVPGSPEPAFAHRRVVAGTPFELGAYQVLPIDNRHHTVPVTGYQVTTPGGKRLLYTGDTGPGIRDIWPLVQPDVLITEVTFPEAHADMAKMVGHLTPRLLEDELAAFREVKGYVPRVLICHVNQQFDELVAEELAEVARRLQATIEIAREGMTLDL